MRNCAHYCLLLDAIQDGVGLLTWSQDAFAYADLYDAATERYRGLEAGRRPTVQLNATSVVVKPEVAVAQQEKDAAAAAARPTSPTTSTTEGAPESGAGVALPGTAPTGSSAVPAGEPRKIALRRFHGTAKIDAARLSRDVDQIASAVVQHLGGLLGAKVNITLEIEAEMPSGAPDNVVRTVTENCRTLKFENSGFEEE